MAAWSAGLRVQCRARSASVVGSANSISSCASVSTRRRGIWIVPVDLKSVWYAPNPSRAKGLAALRRGEFNWDSAPPFIAGSRPPTSPARQERDLRGFAARAGYEVVGVFKETGSGAKLDRAERRKVMALCHARRIDTVLVTELSRWGRGTLDRLHTLEELEARRVSVIAMSGLAFDLVAPHVRMLATVLAGLAEFERERVRERVRSGMAAAKARGKKLGRQPGYRPKSDRLAPKVLALVAKGRSYRLVGRELGLSKNTVAGIIKRARTASVKP